MIRNPIDFTDGPKHHRSFWLVHREGEVDVCPKPPDFQVDIRLSTSVRTLAEVWRGIRPPKREIRTGTVHLDGGSSLRRAFPDWFLLSVYAPIKRKR